MIGTMFARVGSCRTRRKAGRISSTLVVRVTATVVNAGSSDCPSAMSTPA